MKVTMQQIADLCNVSRGTVDRVLHNRPNVHPQIRQTVLSAIEQTGYRMPAGIGQQPRRLLAILPVWSGKYCVTRARRGICTAVDRLGSKRFTLQIEQPDGHAREELLALLDRALEEGVHGILLNAPMDRAVIERVNRATARGVQVVTYFDELPQCPDTYYVGPDAVRAGRVAAGLMAKYLRPGERVLAVSADLQLHSQRGRVYSFAHHLQELTGQATAEIVCAQEPLEATALLVQQQLARDERMRYIYMSAQSAPGCMEGIRRAKLPYRITVICNDTTTDTRALLENGSIDFVIGQSVSQVACQAVEALYKMVCLDAVPRATKRHSDLIIYTKQMLHTKGGER